MSLIAFDAISTRVVPAGTADHTHVVGSTYAHPYLFVATSLGVTSMTYNGVALTKLHTYNPTWPPGTNCPGHIIWGLPSPSTGSNTLHIVAGSDAVILAFSYSTVDPTQPVSYYDEDTANHQVATWTSTGSVSTNLQWILSIASLSTASSNKFGAGSGATLRGQSDTSIIAPTKIALLDLNAEKDVGTYTVNINVLNLADNPSSAFVSTTSLTIEPYRTNVTVTPSVQAPAFTFNAPTIDAIQHVTITPAVQALTLTVYTTIPPVISYPDTQELTFTILPIQAVRTARYYPKFSAQGDNYDAKFTHRM